MGMEHAVVSVRWSTYGRGDMMRVELRFNILLVFLMIMILCIMMLENVFAFQKGDWVYVTSVGNGLLVYDDNLKNGSNPRRSW